MLRAAYWADVTLCCVLPAFLADNPRLDISGSLQFLMQALCQQMSDELQREYKMLKDGEIPQGQG